MKINKSSKEKQKKRSKDIGTNTLEQNKMKITNSSKEKQKKHTT